MITQMSNEIDEVVMKLVDLFKWVAGGVEGVKKGNIAMLRRYPYSPSMS